MPDTIAAIATARAPGAIGILRLSGPDTKAVLDAVFFPANGRPMSRQTPRAMVYGRVLDGEVVLSDALYFYAPALSQGVWINANRTYHTTIGCHRFYL